MGTLEFWRGPDENPCICEYCTPGAAVLGGFAGETCPQCEWDVLEAGPVGTAWVKCPTCQTWFREFDENLELSRE